MQTALELQIQRGLSSLSHHRPVSILWSDHPLWPLPPTNSPNPSSPHRHQQQHPSPKNLNISVLDSSFNPPTLAHLALANTSRPRTTSDDKYDAHLLLLSVRNADKSLKEGDATYAQRVEMMIELARDVRTHTRSLTESGNGDRDRNVAVGITNEPTFVGKSRALTGFLKERLDGFNVVEQDQTQPEAPRPSPLTPRVTLSFILGIDTLIRFFNPKYYTNAAHPEGSEELMFSSLRQFFVEDGSRVVCAGRSPESYPAPEPVPAPVHEVGLGLGLGGVVPPIASPSILPPSSSYIPSLPPTISSVLRHLPPTAISFITIDHALTSISSSFIRAGVKRENESESESESESKDRVPESQKGPSWRTMVSERVAGYILSHGLYK
ncbi:hypothetical protein F5878DRAFT_589937 [Lentinula raphanica]|uniref:Nicotinamide-nucleotide adenylyltransferase n=1 Tax=Lentinula raphanica TaxID=153919 RepID=A0AA38P0G7_9AGAR|nr:hypothetical protein F5878DRAFT_589937 [Lentinula raphanica]